MPRVSHPFLEWDGPIAFAHRGGASDAPENTMPAFELFQPARYEVVAVYDAEAGSAGGTYAVKFGQTALSGIVSRGENQRVSLGQVQLGPGPLEIDVVPKKMRGAELMRLRAIVLQPVIGATMLR